MTPAQGAPRAIADYELLREVGRGSYGEVWLARGVTGVFRAIKVVRRERFDEDAPFDREFNGVSLFARLAANEPRLLSVYHVGRNDSEGFYYYVMEPADDVSLGTEIVWQVYQPRTLQSSAGRPVRLGVSEVIGLGIDLAEALAVLHRNGVVHRDIKPANVIYVAGSPKLADIGLIAPLGANSFVGTEGYVAPEGPGAPSADVFGLGKLLYELATGRDRRDYPRLPDGLEESAETEALLELVGVLNRACARDTGSRYRDADELLDDLRVIRAGKSVEKLRLAQLRFRWALRIAGALLVASLLAGVGALTERQRARAADEARRWAVYSGVLARTQRAAAMDDLAGGRQMLTLPEAIPPGRRSVEWDLVERSVLGPGPLRSWSLGTTGVLQIVAAPQGAESLALDRSGRVWLADGEATRLLGRGVRALGYADSRNRRWLVQATEGSVGWLNSTSGVFEERFRSELGLGAAAAGSHRVVLTNLYQRTRFEVWDLAVEPPRRVMELSPDSTLPDTWGIAISEDGRWLATGRFYAGRTGQRLDLWETTPPRLAASVTVPEVIWAVAFSPSGGEVAAVFDSGSVLRVDTTGSTTPRWTRSAPGRPSYLRYVSDDGALLVGLNNLEVALIPPGASEGAITEPGRDSHGLGMVYPGGRWSRPLAQAERLSAMAWQPGVKRLLTGTAAGALSVWAGTLEPVFRRYRPAENPAIRETVIDPEGLYFAVSSGSNSVDVVFLENGEHRRFEGGWKPVAFADDGLLIAAGDGGRWIGWDVASGRLRWERVPSGGPEPVAQVGATVDGRYLATVSLDGWLRIRDRESDAEVLRARVQEGPPVAWTRATKAAVMAGISVDERIWVWRPGDEHGALSTRAEANGIPLSLALTPDGRRLAVVTVNGALVIYRTDPLEPERAPIQLPVREAFALAFTPDGERVMIGGSSGLIEFRETRNWSEAGTFSFDPAQLGSGIPRPQTFQFDRTGRRLVVALANGDLLWPVSSLGVGAAVR